MPSWIDLENNCFNYLKNKYNEFCTLDLTGKSNSTCSDIRVDLSNKSFYVEVKDKKSQSGQFVVVPDKSTQSFSFSEKNKTSQNQFAEAILKCINSDFAGFSNAGTAGKKININQKLIYSWIKKYYKSKSVNFFISKDKEYIIFPRNKFHLYFDVTATCRVKRSGSSKPSTKYHSDITSYLKYAFPQLNIVVENGRMVIDDNRLTERMRFSIDGQEYYLAKRNNGKFEVRQLSNTYSLTVIFSVKLTSYRNPNDLVKFEKEIKCNKKRAHYGLFLLYSFYFGYYSLR